LSGIAKRTGYSRSYLGNVETGVRAVTPDVIKAYERALGDDVKRRQLILGSVAALTASSTPDTAAAIANDINGGRSGLLTDVQTTHATDRAVAGLVARQPGSVASLVRWADRGKPLLRVNAAGILAKIGSPTTDNEAISVLRADGRTRELYLTAVINRVLKMSWHEAANTAANRGPLADPDQLRLFVAELSNPADSGARYCSVLMLARSHREPAVATALLQALRTEQSRENVRAIGAALAGVDPTQL
jgi:transcriptional regulator with XRE-family HTH domain